MIWRDVAGPPRLLAGALLVLLLGQSLAVDHLRGQADRPSPPRAACGTPLPAVDRAQPLEAQLQLRTELAVGARSSGTAIVVNRGTRAVVVLTTQAVLLAPAGLVAASPPEPPRRAGRLLRQGEFLRQPVTVVVRPCPGGVVRPGFYELALVVQLQRTDEHAPRRAVTSRLAVVVRPHVG